MENQLTLLITLYEEERRKLQALIKACMEDIEGPDYISAHNHQKAVYIVDETIRTLNRFEDNNYDEKKYYISLIEKLEKDLETADVENLRIWLFEMLKDYKRRLEKLNAIIVPPKPTNHATILETALHDLVYRKINEMKIIFNKSLGIFIILSTHGSIIQIVSSVIKKDSMRDSELNLLQKMGFQLNYNNKLAYQFENKGDESLLKLRYLLTKLVFDISYYRHPAAENFIEF